MNRNDGVFELSAPGDQKRLRFLHLLIVSVNRLLTIRSGEFGILLQGRWKRFRSCSSQGAIPQSVKLDDVRPLPVVLRLASMLIGVEFDGTTSRNGRCGGIVASSRFCTPRITVIFGSSPHTDSFAQQISLLAHDPQISLPQGTGSPLTAVIADKCRGIFTCRYVLAWLGRGRCK